MKKILCIIPFYNRASCLRDAIESVLQQTYSNVELVLVSDGSTDNYLETINPYLGLPNVHFITYEGNRGVAYARNRGLECLHRLNCEYFTVHDSDDISDVNRFKTIIKDFDKDTLGIKTTYIKTNMKNEPLVVNEGYDILCSEGIAFYSKKAFKVLGYFNNLTVGEDTDYWWRLEAYVRSNSKFNVKYNSAILYYARIHNDNTSTTFKDMYPGIWSGIRNEVYEMSKVNKFYRQPFK